MATQKITIQATVLAGSKQAWESYTQPQHITKWNFASDDWHCPKATNDLREGGRYLARMEAKDGSFGFDFEGIYTEVIEEKRLSYTLPDGRQVKVIFNGIDSQTEVTVTFDSETENSIELQRNGWQAILNNYKTYTESN